MGGVVYPRYLRHLQYRCRGQQFEAVGQSPRRSRLREAGRRRMNERGFERKAAKSLANATVRYQLLAYASMSQIGATIPERL